MPNCDFYAAKDDLERVLRFVFGELSCRVFDAYSEPEKELREFHGLDGVLAAHSVGACENAAAQICLQLWPVSAYGNVNFRRIKLRQKQSVDPTFRYCIEGWGLIQLYLGGCNDQTIFHSHTNCFGEKGAHRRYLPSMGLGHPAKWDWTVVTSQSRKLNSFIRKVATRNEGNRPILPQAHDLVQQGVTMD